MVKFSVDVVISNGLSYFLLYENMFPQFSKLVASSSKKEE
jgi:hypothetical protein